MDPAALKRAVRKLVSHKSCIKPQARIKELRAEIKTFEQKYEMTTKQMLNKVCSGKLAEKGDIETWLNKYNLLSVHAES